MQSSIPSSSQIQPEEQANFSELIGREPDPQIAFQIAEECQYLLDGISDADSPGHRTLEDGRIHDRGDRRQAWLHNQDRGTEAADYSQALELWRCPAMIADSPRPHGLEALTDSQLRQIDQICDGFEASWNSELRPRIEAFLDVDAGPYRKLLLQELVLIDAEYRRRLEESPRTADYQQRFPELEEQWLEAQLSPPGEGTPNRSARRERARWRDPWATVPQQALPARTTKFDSSANFSSWRGSASVLSGPSGVRWILG